MAIGDSLVEPQGLVGPVGFTPDMEEAGIQLVPNGNTTPARTFTPRPNDPFLYSPQGDMNFGFVGPQSGDFSAGAAKGTMSDASFRQQFGTFFEDLDSGQLGQRANRAAPSAQALNQITPDDVRPVNPFTGERDDTDDDGKPRSKEHLEGDEIKDLGGKLSKLGDFLTSPAATKMLASIGMALTPSRDDPIGESAIQMAESRAQTMFQQRLEAGEAPGDVLVPGLSPQGRQRVQTQFERSQDLEHRQEMETSREERLGVTSELQQENLRLRNEALEAASGADQADPNAIFREGLEAIGEKLPPGVDLSQFTPEQAFKLTERVAILKGIEKQTGKSSSSTALLNEGMKQIAIEDTRVRLQQAREAYKKSGAQTSLALVNRLSERLIELGADPNAPVEGEGGQAEGASDSPGVDKIMEISGFPREEVEDMSAEEKAVWLRRWLAEQGE